MHRDPDIGFVKVNRILGKQASIGPVPADQLLPWMILISIAYFLTQGLFSLGMPVFLFVGAWFCVTWWLLTGKQPHLFVDRFRNPPGTDWINGGNPYLSPIPENRYPWQRSRIPDSKLTFRLKNTKVTSQHRQFDIYSPFQNAMDLCAIVEIKKDGREAAAFLLEKGGKYQLCFGFNFAGIHDLLYKAEVANLADALEEGFKDVQQGERLTFFAGCYSNDAHRQQQLDDLADRCSLSPISVLTRNEKIRTKQLSRKGIRQTWQHNIFATWTTADPEGDKQDAISKFIKSAWTLISPVLDRITGAKLQKERIVLQNLLLKGFQEGFIQWELMLANKIGLPVQPMTAEQLWQWLWKRFNQSEAPLCPQIVTLEATEDGELRLFETVNSTKHPCTLLLQGQSGVPATPQHRGMRDRVFLPGLGKEVAVLSMTDPPLGWGSIRDQLKWMFKIMSQAYVYDTECIVDVSTTNSFLIKENLVKQAKSSRASSERSAQKGQGRDVGAELKAEESFDAQRKLFQGSKAVYAAPLFMVYRNNAEELFHACNLLCNSFETATVQRETNVAWDLFLQALPINQRRLLESGFIGSEKRATLDTETIAGLLPLVVPRSLDRCGVELLTQQGGKPIHVDLFVSGAKRALITGTSGSGKSVLAWRFVIDALLQGIPVVGMDISSGANSTFKTAIELLGDQGAYYDITRGSSNLMEPPDLRRFKEQPAELNRRMEIWKDSLRRALCAISMGKIHDPSLGQRVDVILLRTIDIFFKDPEIVQRYNEAFEYGWKSPQWQEMPVLKDFLRFCSKERLNLTAVQEIDNRAINQIHSQINALLSSKLGNAVGRPSSFSPEPSIIFFALSGLNNEQDAYLMAINAHSACVRNALSHPKSLFVGDELSVLLKKDGFAAMIGEFSATGRKEGISIILISQDPDSICECSAGAQIMANLNYRLTGKITATAVNSFVRYLQYDPGIISVNASEKFHAKRSLIATCWLVETDGRFWQTYYIPGLMVLASVANNGDETKLRNLLLAQQPPDMKGQLTALKHFSDLLAVSITEGTPLKEFIQAEEAKLGAGKSETGATNGKVPHHAQMVSQ